MLVPDWETNKLYLSPLLKKWYPTFAKRFLKILAEHNIDVDWLPHTKDIWCYDFMPMQCYRNELVEVIHPLIDYISFDYNPSYLQEKRVKDYLTQPIDVCNALKLNYDLSELILDGGSIVYGSDAAIVSTRVIYDNYKKGCDNIVQELYDTLDIANIMIMPQMEDEMTGHIDGFIRFMDDETLVVSNISVYEHHYVANTFACINNIKSHEIITTPPLFLEEWPVNAVGCYLNYLHIGDKIFVPVFNHAMDKVALKFFKDVYRNYEIIPVLSTEIARDGGVLNCISWNVKE